MTWVLIAAAIALVLFWWDRDLDTDDEIMRRHQIDTELTEP